MDVVTDSICTSDMSKYFTVPPSVTLDLKHVQEKFCVIDFDVLVKQMSDMTMMDYIIYKVVLLLAFMPYFFNHLRLVSLSD